MRRLVKSCATNLTFVVFRFLVNTFDVLPHIILRVRLIAAKFALQNFHIFMNPFHVSSKADFAAERFFAGGAFEGRNLVVDPGHVTVQDKLR